MAHFCITAVPLVLGLLAMLASPAASDTVCTVTVGGAGKFTSVQAAVASIGKNDAGSPKTVCIGAGVFHGKVVVDEGQDGIALVGLGPENSVISASDSQSKAGSPFTSATLVVKGNNFTAKDLKVENTVETLTDPSPAVALYADQTTWSNVNIEAWDDTLAVRSGASHLVTGSYISGNTDFTWGFGRIAIVDSTLEVRKWSEPGFKGDIATYGTDDNSGDAVAGALFWNCNIIGEGQAYLGRPYRPKQQVAFVNCNMGSAVVAAGWNDYKGYLGNEQNDFREYNSFGPGANPQRTVGKVFIGSPPPEFTVNCFIGRTG